VHNVFQVISLLNTLILAYTKLLDDIAAEANAAELEKRTKSFRFVELDSNMAVSSTGEPAGMEVALSPREWQRLILSAIRKYVYSSPAQQNVSDCLPPSHSRQQELSLESLAVAMEARQKHLHTTREPVIKCSHNEFTCLKMLEQVKQGIAGLSLSRE